MEKFTFPGEHLDCGCHYTTDDDGIHQCRLHKAAPGLLKALEEVMRHCVTVGGFPDKGKGRTDQQQAAYDAARAILKKAKE